MSEWTVVYKKAIDENGELFFPERLTREFLEEQKKRLGSYIFCNQYLNEIIPLEDRVLKPEWLRYYKTIPDKVTTFAFIDPAISEADTADFTGYTVVHCDVNQNWYVQMANRRKLTPTQIVELVFNLYDEFRCDVIGIESVAYQKALLYMVHEESLRRGKPVPVKDVHPGTTRTKETRILGLVPRFEWGRILINQGLHDFEKEYLQFPRASHDDILDSLSQIEQIAYYPAAERKQNVDLSPNHPDYERQYIAGLYKRAREDQELYGDSDS